MSRKPKLTVATIRQLKRALEAVEHKGDISLPVCGCGKLAEGVNLTTDGVVMFPGGFMHPYSFRDTFGEEMYQELLARPRVPSPYPER